MTARHLSWTVAAGICLSTAFAEARTWRFRDVSPPIEAELFDVDGDGVHLQLPDGEVVEYHKSVLKEADRRFVDDWLAAEERIPLGDEIQVSAKPYWQTIRYVGDSLPPHVALVVLLKARGKAAAAATRYSDLKIDEVVADDGTTLALSTDSMGDLRKPVNLNRYGSLEQQPWGFKFKLIWNAPLKPIGAIRRLGGSMKIVTGNKQAITVERVGTTKNRRVDDALLRQAGLTTIENPAHRSAGLFYQGQEKRKQFVLQVKGPRQCVFSVEMLDANGKVIEDMLGRSSSVGAWQDEGSGRKSESTTYQFDFQPPAPTNPRMRVTVLEGAHEDQVPFEFVDLKVPPHKSHVGKHK